MQKRITDYDVKDLIKLAVGAAPGLSSPAPWKASPAISTTGPIKPLGAAKSPHVSVPGAFMSGMGQGVKNQFSAMGNFAKGTANFIGGGLGTLTATSSNPNINQVAPNALKTMGAGARDMTESLGQFVGLNNAFDKNWNYTGAKSPQHVDQQQQQMEQQFPNPKDHDLALWSQGLNDASNAAAKTIPAALTGRLALTAATKFPVLANAGHTIQKAITGNRFLNPLLKTLGVATGMPVHPAVLPGGRLATAAGASQIAQSFVPPLAPGAAHAAARYAGATPEQALQIAQPVQTAMDNVAPYLPAPAVDEAMRNIYPELPAHIDAAVMPSPVGQLLLTGATAALLPGLEEAAQKQQQQQQLAQQQAAEAQQQNQMHVEDAFTNQSRTQQMLRGDNTDYNMTAAMLSDPAMANRMQHGAIPQEVAPQLVQQSGVFPPEQEADAAASISANAPAPAQPAAAQSVATPANTTAGTTTAGTTVNTTAGTSDSTFTPELMTEIQNANTPALKQAVQPKVVATVKQITDQNPQLKKGLLDHQSGNTNTPEAQAFQTEQNKYQNTMVYDEYEKLKKDHPGADLSDHRTYTSFLSQASSTAMTKFNEMPMEHQLLTGLGLGGGLIGLLSSLFGGGGMTGGLLGMLGLAVGGAAGAAGGMFGDQAQAATGKLMGDFGNFMGKIPDEARDANNFRPGSEASKAFEATVRSTFITQGPAAAQKMVNDRAAQFEPLERAYAMNPRLAHSYLMGTKNPPKTPEEAEALYQQMASQVAQARDPNFLTKQITKQVAGNVGSAVSNASAAAGDAYNSARTAVGDAYNSASDWWNTPNTTNKTNGHILKSKEGASMNIAQQIFFKQAAQKAARCWAGYEPVPGKAPYSDNSCRPKRKKKTEKKAEEYSAQPFNPAIGYPPKSGMTPMQHYRNQMYLSGQEVAKNFRNPNPKWSNNYLFAKRHYGEDANGNILMPRAPVSPGQMAAPVAPAQPRLAPPAPINSGSRNYDVVSPPAPM